MVKKSKINKSEFIEKLTNMTPEQINLFIQQKGKKPNLINAIIKIRGE